MARPKHRDTSTAQPHRRPVPRLTGERTDKKAGRIRDVAVELVRARGLEALTFEKLAKHRSLNLSRNAPMHYFGSTIGLVAAIAAAGLDDLTTRLHGERENADASDATLKRLALTYAEYALRSPRLYRAMHASDLWQAVTAQKPKHTTSVASRKADQWIQLAAGAREAALTEFELAVKDAQQAGRVRTAAKSYVVAHLATAIVDGFLFHTFAEHVGSEKTIKELLNDLETLFDLAFTGLATSIDGMQIPFFHKADSGHHDCAPVCLRMALAYLDVDTPVSKIYADSRSLGRTRYTLPWGICLAAAKSTVYATFISKHPDELINADDIAQVAGVPVDEVRRVMQEQLAECRTSEKITLIKYDANIHVSLPASVIAAKTGVVIPGLRWNGGAVHNVVLTRFKDGWVTYHDPNEGSGANRSMPEAEFQARWSDRRTDNDLLIISRDPLPLG